MQRLGTILGAWATKAESWWALGVLLLGSGVSAWVASATEWLDQYGPIGWWAAVLLGALIIALVLAALAKATVWWSERRLHSVYAALPHNINPLEIIYRNQKINLSDFESPFISSYKGKTFENCDIVGPGTIFIYGHSTISDDQFYSCDFVELGEKKSLTSAIGFEDCVIRNSRLYKVTLLVSSRMRETIDKATPGANWITK